MVNEKSALDDFKELWQTYHYMIEIGDKEISDLGVDFWIEFDSDSLVGNALYVLERLGTIAAIISQNNKLKVCVRVSNYRKKIIKTLSAAAR